MCTYCTCISVIVFYLQYTSCFRWKYLFCCSLIYRHNSNGRNYVITRDIFRNENRSNWKINGKTTTMKEVQISLYHWSTDVIVHVLQSFPELSKQLLVNNHCSLFPLVFTCRFKNWPKHWMYKLATSVSFYLRYKRYPWIFLLGDCDAMMPHYLFFIDPFLITS